LGHESGIEEDAGIGKLAARPAEGNFVLRDRLNRLVSMATVSRRDRLTDLAALVVILAGIALYVDAGARMRTISAYSYQHPGPRGESALAAADWARWESYGGLAVAMFGCAVGVGSALRHSQARRLAIS
jgi:hypothetical protein